MSRKMIRPIDGPYKVEKGIKMDRKRTISTRFPFDKMEIGDSFHIPKKDQPQASAMVSIYAAVNSYNRTFGTKVKVACRKDANGVRVWRVADRKK